MISQGRQDRATAPWGDDLAPEGDLVASIRRRQEKAAAGPLDNYKQSLRRTPRDNSGDDVGNPYVCRHLEHKRLRPLVSALERVANCGRKGLFRKGIAPRLVFSQLGGSRYRGFESCMSVWSCPECARRRAVGRIAEIHAAVKAAHEEGWSAAWQTLTIPHTMVDSLKLTLHIATSAWRNITGTYRWKNIARQLDVRGTIRKVEVTDGRNGWHPHVHLTFFFGRELTEEELELLERVVYQGWCAVAEAHGIARPRPELCPLEALNLTDKKWADYVGKALGWELNGQEKKARGLAGRQPFDLLADALKDAGEYAGMGFKLAREILGTGPAVIRWKEYQRATKGAQQLAWSKGLRGKLRLAERMTAAEELELGDGILAGSEEEVVHTFTSREWWAVWRTPGAMKALATIAASPEPLIQRQKLVETLCYGWYNDLTVGHGACK